MRTGHKTIGAGGTRYSVTVTVGYGGDDLRLVVAPNIRAALDEAERRWGPWFTIESISTPETIYADITGETRRRWESNRGQGVAENQTERSKLERALGRKLRDGELGFRRREQDGIPRHRWWQIDH